MHCIVVAVVDLVGGELFLLFLSVARDLPRRRHLRQRRPRPPGTRGVLLSEPLHARHGRRAFVVFDVFDSSRRGCGRRGAHPRADRGRRCALVRPQRRRAAGAQRGGGLRDGSGEQVFSFFFLSSGEREKELEATSLFSFFLSSGEREKELEATSLFFFFLSSGEREKELEATSLFFFSVFVSFSLTSRGDF